MNKTIGILSYGAYIPRNRLQRKSIFDAHAWFAPGLKNLAKGERASANWDEDPITMGVEAARFALDGTDRSSIGSLSLASTTLPFADRLNAGIVKEALNLTDQVSAIDVSGGQRAGTSSLIGALKAAAFEGPPHLCVAAEMRKGRAASESELMFGDAAAALVVGRGDPIARFLGAYSTTLDFVDHYRATGQVFDYVWESRWIRDEGYTRLIGEAISAALASFAVAPNDIAHLAIAVTAAGVANSLAKKAGLTSATVADTLWDRVGDAGVAHPLLMLAAVLDRARPSEKILLVSFGQGVDVILFEATHVVTRIERPNAVDLALAYGRSDTNYVRHLFHRGLLDLERGMRAEADQKQPATTLFRNRRSVLALIGGRSKETGSVQFPKTELSVDSNDRIPGSQEDYPLADRIARIVTYTADNLTYSPDPPSYYGMIDFEGGGRMMAEFTDVDAQDVEVGRPVRMVFRIKALDEIRHFARYFWKATTVN